MSGGSVGPALITFVKGDVFYTAIKDGKILPCGQALPETLDLIPLKTVKTSMRGPANLGSPSVNLGLESLVSTAIEIAHKTKAPFFAIPKYSVTVTQADEGNYKAEALITIYVPADRLIGQKA